MHVLGEGMQVGRCLLLLSLLARDRRNVLGLCGAWLSCRAWSLPCMLHGQHSFLQLWVLQTRHASCAGPG
jgi:hypothetical protein